MRPSSARSSGSRCPQVYICDSCIRIASRIVAQDEGSRRGRALWRRALDAARRLVDGFRRGALLEGSRAA